MFDEIWNLLGGRVDAPFLGKFIDYPAFGRVNTANRGRQIVGQTFVIRQISTINPENRTYGHRSHNETKRDHTEDGAKEGKNEPGHRFALTR